MGIKFLQFTTPNSRLLKLRSRWSRKFGNRRNVEQNRLAAVACLFDFPLTY
jgi:hypothetical protein